MSTNLTSTHSLSPVLGLVGGGVSFEDALTSLSAVEPPSRLSYNFCGIFCRLCNYGGPPPRTLGVSNIPSLSACRDIRVTSRTYRLVSVNDVCPAYGCVPTEPWVCDLVFRPARRPRPLSTAGASGSRAWLRMASLPYFPFLYVTLLFRCVRSGVKVGFSGIPASIAR